MMTPAEFKAAREAKLKAKAWNDDRIRREIAECTLADSWTLHVPVPAASRERAKTIAIAGGWRVSLWTFDGGGLDTWIMDLETGGPAASVNLETYRGPVAIVLPTAAEYHTRVAGLVPLTRKEATARIDDAIAIALSDGGDPRVTVRQHSAQLVVDVAAGEGWIAYARDGESVIRFSGRPDAYVDISLHTERLRWLDQDEWREHDPLSPRPRVVPPSASSGCEVCGAWWVMTPDGSVCVNGHHPRRGWT